MTELQHQIGQLAFTIVQIQNQIQNSWKTARLKHAQMYFLQPEDMIKLRLNFNESQLLMLENVKEKVYTKPQNWCL